MSAIVAPKNKVYFAVQVFESLEGKTLKSLKPDEDGYYSVPLAMLDATSRNNAYYDVDSIVNEIVNNNTVFNMMLTQGNLRGEYGHPSMGSDLVRIDTILEDRVSHHIAKVWTGERTDKGIILYGKIKPTGPYGSLLESSLCNAKENTTFSLRCLMTQRTDNVNKRYHRTVKRLVTFDYVNMPGYMEASKWFAPGTESFIQEISFDSLFDPSGSIVGLETWSDKDLANLFGVSELMIGEKRGTYVRGTNTYYNEKGSKHSVVHAILKNKRNY